MAEYEDQRDAADAICPYCGARYQVQSEDYNEIEREEACESCGRKYWINQEITVETITQPDCELNGEPHRWRELCPGWMICSACGEVSEGKEVDRG